jgi:hypothetical protein
LKIRGKVIRGEPADNQEDVFGMDKLGAAMGGKVESDEV